MSPPTPPACDTPRRRRGRLICLKYECRYKRNAPACGRGASNRHPQPAVLPPLTLPALPLRSRRPISCSNDYASTAASSAASTTTTRSDSSTLERVLAAGEELVLRRRAVGPDVPHAVAPVAPPLVAPGTLARRAASTLAGTTSPLFIAAVSGSTFSAPFPTVVPSALLSAARAATIGHECMRGSPVAVPLRQV